MKRLSLIIIAVFVGSLCTLAAGKKREPAFDRGVGQMNSVFIPKGTIGGGVTVSYNTYDLGGSTNDVGYSMLFSLLSGIKGSMYTYGIAPNLSYFVADNFSVGLRFDYDETQLQVGNLGISLGDLASLSIKDYNMSKISYSGSLTGRYYMPIANSRRIAMFGEFRLTGNFAESLTYQAKDGYNTGTFQTIYGAALNIVPGLCVFATNNACVEVAVGILGIDYQYVVQESNLVQTSTMQRSGANFKINPLSINLGVAFYIPTVRQNKAKNKR